MVNQNKNAVQSLSHIDHKKMMAKVHRLQGEEVT